jgi:mono/diheme cytochrome c family protein
MRQEVPQVLALGFLFAIMTASNSCAADTGAATLDGRTILESRCGRCHAIGKTGKSPLGNAPPLRDIYRQYPIERLEFELSEGIGSRHKAMPQIQFSSEQIDKILTYLQSISETN